MDNDFRCGFVSMLGRTNAGKSTLVNALTNEKVSITSHKVQTTRNNINAIVNVDNIAQIIIVDTPGIHLWLKKTLNQMMLKTAVTALTNADLAVLLIEANSALNNKNEIPDLESHCIKLLRTVNKPAILAINKIDLLQDSTKLLPIIDYYKQLFDFSAIVPISALKRKQLSSLTSEIIKLLPISPKLFPDDLYTDQSERFLASEIIRETIIQRTQKEIPYSVIVEINDYKENSLKKLTNIMATIYVERQSQKAILIGKNATKIKELGTIARKSLEHFLNKRIYLDLVVKVKENWPENLNELKKFGYVPEQLDQE